jgi:hypothetical protein
MACINYLDQNGDTGVWTGVERSTGKARTFNTLEDYKQYTKSLENQGTYCGEVEPQYAPAYKPGQNTTPTGFLEFRPRDPTTQAKYDALSKTWEGVASSEKAVASGLYSLDAAEATRQELRAQYAPAKPMPRFTETPTQTKTCSIQ